MKNLSTAAFALGVAVALCINTCLSWTSPTLPSYPSDVEVSKETAIPKIKPIKQFEPDPYDVVMRKLKTWTGADFNAAGDTLAAVEIGILSEKYIWACGSDERIYHEKDTLNISEFNEVVKNLHYHKHFDKAKAIICIGTASAEGERANEEWRARKRAIKLQDMIQAQLGKKATKVYALNLGQYLGAAVACAQTVNQRRLVVVKVTHSMLGLTDKQLEESLKRIFLDKAINNQQQFPLDIRKYSKYESNYPMLINPLTQ